MSEGAVQEAVAGLRAACDALAGCDMELLTKAELLEVLDDLETVSCQLPTQWRRGLTRLLAETSAKAMGAKSWNEVLRVRWRLSSGEAGRRLAEAEELGPRRTLTGEPLAPVLAATAAAQGAGLINAEHVDKIRDAMKHLPGFVDVVTRERIEVDLVRHGVGVGPADLKKVADKILFLLDQDGPEPDDRERDRKRGVTVGPQRRDGTREVRGCLTPEVWAIYEAIFATAAAPGMGNPADETPCVSGTPSQAQIEGDDRSLAQRQHDALAAVGRHALESGQWGQHNGLPTTVIIRTTLQDLQSRAGVGVTGGGSLIPTQDLIRMAGRANLWLAVFDGASGKALDLFRSRRTASAAQRIMLIARDGGCTKPGCTVGPYGCQAHHGNLDWANGGLTNVDELTLACGCDNRLVEDGGWSTTINARGEAEWTPPPALDTGQSRINTYHRPELLLRPPEEPPPPQPNPHQAAKPASGWPDDGTNPWDFGDTDNAPPTDTNHPEIEDFNPWADDNTDEPETGTAAHGP